MNMRIRSLDEKVYRLLSALAVAATSLTSLLPLLYVVSMSLVTDQEWTAKNGFILWPSKPTLLAYERIVHGTVFVSAFGISALRTVLGTVLTLAATVVTAYVLSRRELPGRKALLFGVLFTILVNSGMIPSYLVVRDTHLLNSIWALVIPMLVDSWSVLVLRQFFENVPSELEQSARIDGAGEWVLMTKIMLPMAAPAIAAIGLFTAVTHWNAWFDALLYINDPHRMPLQLVMRNMFANVDLGFDMNAGITTGLNPAERVSEQSLKMAVAVVGILPILCIYPFIQKHFTKGMYLGAIKG
jgi:putative aldouronate transport system permease protein